jgi:hypothetical protein
VVVFVAGRVECLVVVIADLDVVSVVDPVIDEVVLGVESPYVDIEGLDDRANVADVVVVGMGQDNSIERLDRSLDPFGRVEIAAGVDERGSLAVDEKRVTGERTDALCDVPDSCHTGDNRSIGLGVPVEDRGPVGIG